MLHKHINKILLPKKRSSIAHQETTKYDPTEAFLNSSPKLSLQKDINSSVYLRRSSMRNNSMDFTNMNSHENFISSIEAKNKKIWELEARLAEISDLLFELYLILKESLILDEVTYNKFYVLFYYKFLYELLKGI